MLCSDKNITSAQSLCNDDFEKRDKKPAKTFNMSGKIN